MEYNERELNQARELNEARMMIRFIKQEEGLYGSSQVKKIIDLDKFEEPIEINECNNCNNKVSTVNTIYAKNDGKKYVVRFSGFKYEQDEGMKPYCISCLSDETNLCYTTSSEYGSWEYSDNRASWPTFRKYFILIKGVADDICNNILLPAFFPIICDYLIDQDYYKIIYYF